MDERFWELVGKADDHWLFHGIIMPSRAPGEGGYGQFVQSKHQLKLAHRVAWELATGEPVPSGKLVLHTCDIRTCVRNDDVGIYIVEGRELPRRGHLFLGTHADNMADAYAKGRFIGVFLANRLRDHPSGAESPLAKLRWEEVEEIKTRLKAGESQGVIARDYGVHQMTISNIARGKRYSVGRSREEAPTLSDGD